MKYYYHEKERLSDLFSRPDKIKLPVDFYLRDRSTITISPPEMKVLASVIGSDDNKIKSLLSHKNIVQASLLGIRENIRTINNNKPRRSK